MDNVINEMNIYQKLAILQDRIKETLEPKTHFRRTCRTCLELHGKVGCSLPFRRAKLRPSWRLFILADLVSDRRIKTWK